MFDGARPNIMMVLATDHCKMQMNVASAGAKRLQKLLISRGLGVADLAPRSCWSCFFSKGGMWAVFFSVRVCFLLPTLYS